MRSMAWKDIELPTLDQWQGIQSHSFNPQGHILIEADSTSTLSVDFSPMRPGALTRLKAIVEVTPTAGNTATITFAEQHQALEPGVNQVILESRLILDPIMRIIGVAVAEIIALNVQILFPDKSQPLPYDLIGFDMYTPNLDPGFIIGRSKIGRAPLGGRDPLSQGFIIGQSRLDEGYLPVTLPPYSWNEILGPGLSLSIRQGANTGSSLLPVAQAGTATITIKDLDPRKAHLRVGLKCRVYHRITRRLLFTGALRAFSMNPGKMPHEHDVATLEFVDTVGQLAATKRYGVRINTPETLAVRIERLIGKGFKWRIMDGTPPLADALGPTVMEANLAEYLDITCATVGAAWWVDTDGTIIIQPNNERFIYHNLPYFVIGETPLDAGKLASDDVTLLRKAENFQQVEDPFIIGETPLDEARVGASPARFGFIIGQSRLDEGILTTYQSNTAWAVQNQPEPPLFTDRYSTSTQAHYYIDITPGFTNANMLSEVAVENHYATAGDSGWSDNTTTYKATSFTAEALYGANSKTIKACAPSSASATALAEYLLNRPRLLDDTALKISSVQMNALPDSERLTRLTLFDYCQIEFETEKTNQQIYAMENQLTPYTWKERLYVTPARERIITL